ncbi:MAG: radical SAM protein [Nanoarchaeota archaeon]|nr:radical SAM protein [Nanoarchaeota archaeon]
MDKDNEYSINPSESHTKTTWFERAIFISWYCAKPTCKFCYMYSIKDQIKTPMMARRRLESILAEALITKICGWEIGFVSAGIGSWKTTELKEVLEGIKKITGKKTWLNLGFMPESQLTELAPWIEGVTGTVECPRLDIREDIVPDKPIDKIDEMFGYADKLKLKKSITIIIGLGETIDDFKVLSGMIEKWKIHRINFYRLVPHESTVYTEGPSTEYYLKWINMTRLSFPDLQIIAGSWPDKTSEIEHLLTAGADAITKLPAIKYFGKKPAVEIEEGAKKAGRKFIGTLTKYPKVDAKRLLYDAGFDENIAARILEKYERYRRKLER